MSHGIRQIHTTTTPVLIRRSAHLLLGAPIREDISPGPLGHRVARGPGANVGAQRKIVHVLLMTLAVTVVIMMVEQTMVKTSVSAGCEFSLLLYPENIMTTDRNFTFSPRQLRNKVSRDSGALVVSSRFVPRAL